MTTTIPQVPVNPQDPTSNPTSTPAEQMHSIGQPLPRIDGLAKVTGQAIYSFDHALPDMVFGTILSATIPHGQVVRVDHRRALALPGVLRVYSCENQPPTPPRVEGGAPYIWFDREIRYDGQDVAMVVATTQAIADEAVGLITVDVAPAPFVATVRAAMAPDAPQAGETPNVEDPGSPYGEPAQYTRGDVAAGLLEAAVTITAAYDLPSQIHNPWEAHVTLATWDGDCVTVYDSVQYPIGARNFIANALGIPSEQVRVIAEYVGGGFGSKLSTKTQAPLAALAARHLERPVRVRLTRAQMHRNARHRPQTLHHLRLGATSAGILTAIDHEVWSGGAPKAQYYESAASTSRYLYACPNLRSAHWRVRVNQNPPGSMRAPGEQQSQFALECALDELAHALRIDPITLRQRNQASTHAVSGKPFSRNSIPTLLDLGSQRIGWDQRAQPPGSQRDGALWRGIGCAVAFYPLHMARAEGRVRLQADGSVLVESSGVDLGTGTYTILAQAAADGLGTTPADITVHLGDTTLPVAPIAGGSMLAASVTPAVYSAALDARQQLIDAALDLPDGLFAGCSASDLVIGAGRVTHRRDAGRAITFAELLRLRGTTEIVGQCNFAADDLPMEYGNFGAHFAEVTVDVETGIVRVPRFVAVHDSGRVLNPTTYRSQIRGGIIWGLSAVLLEASHMDGHRGRITNANLVEYLVPTALDIGEIDVTWLDEPDAGANALGMKSAGEVGITGAAPAIANAIFNATGLRLRHPPFQPPRVLMALRAAGITA